ncbi:unnamed protein product, partial [Prunus brigantina]
MKMRMLTTSPRPGNRSFITPFLLKRSEFHSDADNNVSDMEILIQTRCKSGTLKSEEALGYFNSMIQMKPIPSYWTFNCLFGALSKMKLYSAVVFMYKQLMGCRQFQPDVSTMNIFMNCLCRLNRVDLGFSVLSLTLKCGLEPDAYSLNALLQGLCKNSSLSEAMELFRKIEEKGYPCDEFTYSTIINGLCKAGKTCMALKMLKEMQEHRKSKLNPSCYNPGIGNLCKERRIEEALTLFQDMISNGVGPDIFSYTSLIKGL